MAIFLHNAKELLLKDVKTFENVVTADFCKKNRDFLEFTENVKHYLTEIFADK